jgi:hypothetical protein
LVEVDGAKIRVEGKLFGYTRILREFGQQKAKMGDGMISKTMGIGGRVFPERLCNKSGFYVHHSVHRESIPKKVPTR